MSSKNNEKDKKGCQKQKSCGTKSPGPVYNLKPLVGYEDHCQSKYREPAYTIGKAKRGQKDNCLGPGPKYMYDLPGVAGYTFPRAVVRKTPDCSPGPKYTLPGFWSPAFSIVNKPRVPCPQPLSGPYDPPKLPTGPTFPFAGKPKPRPCEFSPPIRDIGDTCLVLPCSPKFSIVSRPKRPEYCSSPGPKYLPQKQDNPPAYTFGLKHSECSTIPRTECDELC